MINELTRIIECEDLALKELMNLLKLQYKMIMDKDVFGLEGLVDKMNECNKQIAAEEVNRRKLIGKESMRKLVSEAKNQNLNIVYNKIQNTLKELTLQKETNDMLLKQQIIFNNQMLNIMNPNREIKTYNSYGNLRK
ncbi:flagellar protein FlgN [Clostridium weizhouense]|uniref:Flagellar protein FlgN n=1 Tax=Clostridium weizhouense TaxID=2859781 RepID=A0ABS7AIU9_9CLOT|nr:flagellar protein FlgN [Clostridium weizhouense]MBW6408591.1 flagellar protein FlgN [Clostridium weizhouense]